MQACLGCHVAIPETAFGTQKAWQRLGSKFKNCIVILNEFKSNEASNTMLCQIHDREGYGRAKRDDTLDTDFVEVNSAYTIVSTQNVVGGKAEDVHSRLIEINSDKFEKSNSSIDWIMENLGKMSCLVYYCLYVVSPQEILDQISTDIKELRKLFAEAKLPRSFRFCGNTRVWYE